MPIKKPKLSFSEIEKIRKKDAFKIKQAQELAGLIQIKSSFLEKNIPSSLKLKGTQALGKRVLDIVKNKIFKIIIPKIQQLKDKYSIQAFQEAKANATTPQQIDQIKKQFCPTKSELVELVQIRNNIVSQLNVIGKNINTISKTVDRLQKTTTSLDRLLKQINKTKIAVSLAAKFIPPMAFPGSIASLLSDLETIDDSLIPIIEKNKGALSAVPAPIAVALSTIDKIKKILNQLDVLITFCAIPSIIELTPFSEDINNISLLLNPIENEETTSGNEEGGENNYNGFIIQIEEVPFNDKIIRKRAIGLDKNGIKLVQTELSFTTNPQTLIEELKLIIDRDNLKAY